MTFRPRLRLLAVVWLAAFCVSCERDSANVETTIPFNGQKGVSNRSIVSIRLTNTMSAEDATNTDSSNVTVTGDQTDGVYSGSIQPSYHRSVFNGQTVEQFQAGIVTPDGQLPIPDPSDMGTEETGDDTLVFLLDSGVSFKPGEVVTVTLSDKITVRGVPFGGTKTFQFTVGGGSERADSTFFVSEIRPRATSGLDLQPILGATVSEDVDAASLMSAVNVRGDISGRHTGGFTSLASGSLRDLQFRLDPADSFVPGENVTLAWTSSVRRAGAAEGEDASLAPYVRRFQVRPGQNAGGFDVAPQPSLGAATRALVVAELDPMAEGAEVVIATADALVLLRRSEDGGTDRLLAPVAAGFEALDAVAVDGDGDGSVEVVALLASTETTRFQTYELEIDDEGNPGAWQAAGTPFDFPAPNPRGLHAADLDSDSKPELILLHDETTFVQTILGEEIPGAPEQSTGEISFFTLDVGVPADIDVEDILNLQDMQELVFQPTRRAILNFTAGEGIGTADLDSDGRLDIISQAPAAVVLYRNQSSAESPLSFRRASALETRSTVAELARAWTVTDFDLDGDQDILTWDSTGALLHENFEEQSSDSSVRGLLFESSPPVPAPGIPLSVGADDVVLSRDLDGDDAGTQDIIVGRASGVVDLVYRSVNGTSRVDSLPGSSPLSALALADLNGDTGLDVVAAGTGGPRFYLSQAESVTAPELTDPTAFSLVDVSTPQDLEAGRVRVQAIGDITREFSGYSVGLDYDEAVLDFLEFQEPADFRNQATFVICPAEPGGTCAGQVGVRMSYDQSGVGAPFPRWVLGTFLFEGRSVAEVTSTEILFRDFQNGDDSFANSITLAEDGAEQEAAVRVLSDPLEVQVLPPPPPALVVSCSVLERLATRTRVQVRFSAQVEEYDDVLVTLLDPEGAAVSASTVPWAQGSTRLDVDLPGRLSVRVDARRGGDTLVTESCDVVSVFRPEITRCEFDGEANLIAWNDQPEAEFYHVYRNGVRVVRQTRSDTTQPSFRDERFSTEGADLYEVSSLIGGVESLRAVCRGRDPNPCVTNDPVPTFVGLAERTTAVSPMALSFRWENGEAYDVLLARLSFTPLEAGDPIELLGDGLELEAGAQSFDYVGDPDRGGALPGFYVFSLQASNRRPTDGSCPGDGEFVTSGEILFETLSVQIPSLEDVQLRCQRTSVDDLLVTWLSPWRGYDENLSLFVTQVVDGVETEVGGDGQITGPDDAFDLIRLSDNFIFVRDIEPVGTYRVRLVARFGTQTVDAECDELQLTPGLAVGTTLDDGTVTALIGAESFELPIRATGIFQTVDRYQVEVEVPEVLTIEGFESVAAVGGVRRISLENPPLFEVDPDPDGDRRSDGEVILRTLRARLDPTVDFNERPDDSVRLSSARIGFTGSANLRSVPDAEGSIRYVGRYVTIDSAEVLAGSDEDIELFVRVTFDAPEGVEDFAFNSFSVALLFDPDVLELLPLRNEDQQGLVVDPSVFFLPGDSLDEANEHGVVSAGWVGIINPFNQRTLDPVEDGRILRLHFRSRLPANSPDTVTSIRFATAQDELPATLSEEARRSTGLTTFLAVRDVPGADIDVSIPGTITIRGRDDAPRLGGLEPERGALTGGNEVLLFGQRLVSEAGLEPTLRLISRDDPTHVLEVPAQSILSSNAREIRFLAPDSLTPLQPGQSARGLPERSETVFDLEVETATGDAFLLEEAYAYDAPRLISFDVESVRAGFPDPVRVRGTGLSSETAVFFVLPDGERFEAPIVRAPPSDGTHLIVSAPTNLPLPEPGADPLEAQLEVLVSDLPGQGGGELASLRFTDPIRIVGSDLPLPELSVASIAPTSVRNCHVEPLTVRGDGFDPSARVTLPGFSVDPVTAYRNSTSLEVTLPGALEAGTFDVVVTSNRGVVQLDNALTITTQTEFIRGDADGSGGVTVADATLLLAILFGGNDNFPSNRDALDANDDGAINLGDGIRLLGLLFQSGSELAAPYPEPGQDPTPDPVCD